MQNALRMLCEIALARRQGRKAAETLEALRAMDPGHPYLHYLSGRCLLQENERPAAIQAFERFSGKEPSFGRMRLRALVQEGR